MSDNKTQIEKTEQGTTVRGDPDIGLYEFRKGSGGYKGGMITFTHAADAPARTQLIVCVLELPGADGESLYKLAIKNDTRAEAQTEGGAFMFFYSPEETTLLLGLDDDVPQAQGGFFGPFRREEANRFLAKVRDTTDEMYKRFSGDPAREHGNIPKGPGLS